MRASHAVLGCFCCLMVAVSDAAVVAGVCGVLDPTRARYFWPAALHFSNATEEAKQLEWLVLGPESQEVGTKKLQESFANMTKYMRPSPNDSTLLAEEIWRLRQQVRYMSLWDRRVGKSVRDKYKQSEERFAVFAVDGPENLLTQKLLRQFETRVSHEIQLQGVTHHRAPQVTPSIQAYKVQPLDVGAAHPQERQHAQTSLVTHCTIDRLDRLKTLLLSWGGMASVAVYIRPTDAVAPVAEFALELAKMNSSTLQADFALVHGLHPSEEYPINTVRNVAVAQANRQSTSLLFMVDVDFVPSRGLRAALDSPEIGVAAQTSLIIVPAFEWLKANAPLPTTFEGLLPEHQNGTARQFHVAQCTVCHGRTDYARWFESSANSTYGADSHAGYPVTFGEFYEPYLVVRKDAMFMYDEQFVGYGFNKQIQVLHSAISGKVRQMRVLLREFIIAAEHPTTEFWRRFVNVHSWYRYHKLASYFEVKQQILSGTYQPALSLSTRRLLSVGSG